MITTVQKDCYIRIDYSFSSPDGQLLGSSEHSGAMIFRHGSGDAIRGLDNAVAGHEVGTTLDFVVEPQDAYGEHDPELLHILPRHALAAVPELRLGQRLNINQQIMTITSIEDTEVVLDANHPLAGVPLHFHLTILSIDDEPSEDYGQCGCGGSCSCKD